MNTLSIAVAQSKSIKGNINDNIVLHQKYIDIASENNVDIIVFPELSLTGYERIIAKEKALSGDENILLPLSEMSNEQNITIIAGCPIRSEYSKPYIGALVIQPFKKITVYRKRYLHPGEENYFVPSQDNVIYRYKGESVGIAICADINNPEHPADAKKSGATIYAAGVMITPNGIADAYNNLAAYASKYKMPTMMANYAAETGGYETGGGSAIWNEKGEMLVGAESSGQSILIAYKEDDVWKGKGIKI